MAISSITIAVIGVFFAIIIGCFYTLFSLILRQFLSAKKESPPKAKKRSPKFKKQTSPSPTNGISTQTTQISFRGIIAFLLILLAIPFIYFNTLGGKAEKTIPPSIEQSTTPKILKRPPITPSKEGKQWHITIEPEERVEKPNSKKQMSSAYHTQKEFVIELASFNYKEQADKAAKSFDHPTKVIRVGNKCKLIIGDFNTLIEADNYLQKSQLKGFIYQIRTHNTAGRRI